MNPSVGQGGGRLTETPLAAFLGLPLALNLDRHSISAIDGGRKDTV
jgi:hypothetical protein